MGTQVRLRLAALAIFAASVGAGGAIRLVADEAPPEAAGYVIVNGEPVAVSPSDSKRYVRELERFGGKAAVLFDEFDRWFGSLWRGRRLGSTIAVLGAAVAFALYLLSRAVAPRPPPSPPRKA